MSSAQDAAGQGIRPELLLDTDVSLRRARLLVHDLCDPAARYDSGNEFHMATAAAAIIRAASRSPAEGLTCGTGATCSAGDWAARLLDEIEDRLSDFSEPTDPLFPTHDSR